MRSSVSRSRALLSMVILGALTVGAGCGHIEYRDRGARRDRTRVATAGGVSVRANGPTYTVVPGPAPTPRVAVFVVPPQPRPAFVPPRPMPPPPTYAVAPPPPPPQGGELQCSGNQRLRIHNQVVDGHGGPAVVASGNCVIELSESIVRGTPALVASGNAQVRFVESRIIGDVRAMGNSRIDQSGSTHRGQMLRGR